MQILDLNFVDLKQFHVNKAVVVRTQIISQFGVQRSQILVSISIFLHSSDEKSW